MWAGNCFELNFEPATLHWVALAISHWLGMAVEFARSFFPIPEDL